jgi:hypothetical protein
VFAGGTVRPVENHVRQALGWIVLRDASEGRPPHIWAPGTPNKNHALAFAASLITFGCIANMDVHESVLKEGGGEIPEGKTPLDGLQAAFALGNAVSPYMQGTEPLRWAAIRFSERIRNDRGGDFVAAWREVLWPLVGAYKELTSAGVPVGIVNDQQLEENALGGYRLLVLPNPTQLNAAQQEAIARFRRHGAVIENDSAWPWSDPAAGATADAALRRAIRPRLENAPVRVVGGPPGRYGVSYRTPSDWWWRLRTISAGCRYGGHRATFIRRRARLRGCASRGTRATDCPRRSAATGGYTRSRQSRARRWESRSPRPAIPFGCRASLSWRCWSSRGSCVHERPGASRGA